MLVSRRAYRKCGHSLEHPHCCDAMSARILVDNNVDVWVVSEDSLECGCVDDA